MHFLRLEQKKGTFELLCRRFVGQAAVPRESLLNLDFRLPSIEEQSKVISKLNELFSFAEQIEKSVHEAKKRTDIIDQAILSKAFRGELVPQDPNDEPASVLLERIKQEKELEIKQTSIE
jgi:type I restriction enzyme S subunit